jgi:hypothetical protein
MPFADDPFPVVKPLIAACEAAFEAAAFWACDRAADAAAF